MWSAALESRRAAAPDFLTMELARGIKMRRHFLETANMFIYTFKKNPF
jgi:hypothetical protein